MIGLKETSNDHTIIFRLYFNQIKNQMEKIFMCNGKKFSSMENVLDYTDCNKFVVTDATERAVKIDRKRIKVSYINVRSV